MRRHRLPTPLLLSMLLLLLAGCATGPGSTPAPTPTPTPTPAPASLGGNWQLEVVQSSGPLLPLERLVLTLNGALSVSGSTVSGTFQSLSVQTAELACFPPMQDIAFTGSVSSSNVLTLSSAPVNGGVITVTGQLPVTNDILNGTATITGGNCALSGLTLEAIEVPSVTGTYTGTLSYVNSAGAIALPVGSASLSLTQGPVNADGQYPLTGTLNFTAPSCSLSLPLTGTISGLLINLSDGSPSQPVAYLTAGPVPPQGALIDVALSLYQAGASGCPAGLYEAGSLSL